MEYWQSLSDKLTKRTKIHLVNATISPAAFSAHHIHLKALEVLSKLTQKKYNAYLVGGCIRDLLLDMTPKDFDVTTNARPEAIKPLFKCARMIGRRFRLVHVVFGRDIIEVSTFRGPPKKNKITSEKATRDQGFLIRDNVYGTIEEDALRRDFTINALYYDHQTHQVIDFSTGLQDIK
ncbi:MAG: polynucleotide adenylyltransferase PcnB, partial [Endozoicomonadaceae bacterium]|nr:polynucleotide adenylyltransferase PcnB [Endozoicomonadaceae bacterium]